MVEFSLVCECAEFIACKLWPVVSNEFAWFAMSGELPLYMDGNCLGGGVLQAVELPKTAQIILHVLKSAHCSVKRYLHK